MRKIINLIRQFLCNEDGVSSIEYALLGTLIAVVIAVAVSGIGTSLSPFFFAVAAAI